MKTPEQLINAILDKLDGEAESSIEAMNTVTDGSEQIHEGRGELANQLFNWIIKEGMEIPSVKEAILNEE